MPPPRCPCDQRWRARLSPELRAKWRHWENQKWRWLPNRLGAAPYWDLCAPCHEGAHGKGDGRFNNRFSDPERAKAATLPNGVGRPAAMRGAPVL